MYWNKDGTQTPYSLNDIRTITFSTGNIIIAQDNDSTSSFTLNEIHYLNFAGNSFPDLVKATQQKSDDFQLYPNPARNILNLKFDAQHQSTVSVKIFSSEGKLMSLQKFSAYRGINNAQINIDILPCGMYILHIDNANAINVTKFLKY